MSNKNNIIIGALFFAVLIAATIGAIVYLISRKFELSSVCETHGFLSRGTPNVVLCVDPKSAIVYDPYTLEKNDAGN